MPPAEQTKEKVEPVFFSDEAKDRICKIVQTDLPGPGPVKAKIAAAVFDKVKAAMLDNEEVFKPMMLSLNDETPVTYAKVA